ncbi:MAG: ABC transporter substrate-binding protein [Candidatus Eisenbacteria bacterium]
MPTLLPSVLLFTLLLAGCPQRVTPVVFHWWAGGQAPVFDPDGPPDPLRQAFERLLTRALVTEDSLGRPVLDGAQSVEVSSDRLRYTFSIRPGLRFVDGAVCGSDAFRVALLAGLTRTDHGTRLWQLGAVRGIEGVRPRRELPVLAITAPDPATLVIDLARPDSMLLHKLAAPGTSGAWVAREEAPSWSGAVGLGPYRVQRTDARTLVLVRVSGAGPDTVSVRFGVGAARARSALRGGEFDLMWPLPPALLDQPLPAAFASRTRGASPPRRLSLVMRADVPKTTRLAARRALAHGIARSELVRRLGEGAGEVGEWLPGAGPAELPGLDRDEIQRWLERGKLGRSFHVRVAFDADGAGAALARGLQGDWARSGLSVDLVPLRGKDFSREALQGQAQVLLVEEQGLIEGPLGVLATSVLPIRGPSVGAFRTGWRTREFDPWLLPRKTQPAFDPELALRRLEEETVVVPLCMLDWLWVEKAGGQPVGVHPRFGPAPAALVTSNKTIR